MEQEVNLISEALNLTLFGMGFVFLFLTVLVGVTKLMSIIIQRLHKKGDKVDNQQEVAASSLSDEIDEETKFVIEQAIKMHRGA